MTFTISQTPDAANEYLYPNGDDSTEFTPSTGSTNYTLVDDTWNNPTDTDYVSTNSTTEEIKDVYTVEDSGVGSGTINWVRVYVRAKASENKSTSSLTLRPTNSGDSTILKYYDGGWHDPNPTKNYTCVDDTSTDDYVYWDYDQPDKIDLYEIENTDLSDITISKIEVKVRAKSMNAANTGGVRPVIKTGGTQFDGTLNGTDTSWTWYTDTWTTNPSTSVAWTVSDINSLQAGVEIRGQSSYHTVCCEVKVVVYYTPKFEIICDDGTEDTSDKAPITDTWTKYYNTWTDSPSGDAWTWSDIDSMLIGFSSTNDCTISISQAYAMVNYTPSANSVTLTDPKNVECSHSRNIKRINFSSGNYNVYDHGRSGKTLTLTGTQVTDAATKMNTLKTMTHYGAYITLSGMADSNLDTNYMVQDFNFNESEGGVSRMYDWHLVLEEV